MPTSEARILANRANSLRSTGPKTAEGKQRSRRNGLKHGMTGKGVVVPKSDAAEVERRDEALRAEMGPKSTIGAILIRQMATLSVRMERGATQEMASVASRALHAAEEFDEARVDRAARLLAAIGDDPRGCVRRLRKSPEGIDLLVEGWRELRAELTRSSGSTWDSSRMVRGANLAGLGIEEPGAGRIVALSRATWGNFEGLAEDDGAGLDREARKAWARARIIEWVDGEIAELEEHCGSLDLEAIERDRAGAADRALFDPSQEASLARRYESEARRGFFRALKEFRQAEAEAEAEVEAVEEAESAPPASPEVGPSEAPLASCWDGPSPGPAEAPMTPSPAIAKGFDVARGLDRRSVAVGRLAPSPG